MLAVKHGRPRPWKKGSNPPLPPLALIPSSEGGCLLPTPRGGETSAPAPFVLGQTVRRLAYGLEPRRNRSSAAGLRCDISVQVGEQQLCLTPALRRHPQRDVAATEAIQRPVGSEGGLDLGLDQRLVPGSRGPHVSEVAHHLPAVKGRVIHMDRCLDPAPAPGRSTRAKRSRRLIDLAAPFSNWRAAVGQARVAAILRRAPVRR